MEPFIHACCTSPLRRAAPVRVARHRARRSWTTYAETHPDVAVDTWDLWDGTLPEFGPAAAAAKMAVFAGAEPARARRPWPGRPPATTFERFAAADRVPVQRADVERRHAVHPQAVHRRRQPARPGLRLRPRRGYTGLLTGKKAAVVYTSAVYGAGRGRRVRRRTSSRRIFDDWLRWAASRTSPRSRSGPTSPPPTPRPAAAALAAARDAGKLF